MKFLPVKTIFSILGLLILGELKAQPESAADVCETFIVEPFVSDGQKYAARFSDKGKAEFNVVFYGGVRYRVAVSASRQVDLFFSLTDKEGNRLFSGDKYGNPPFWDFTFENTMTCKITLHQKQNNNIETGYAYMAIGYKQN